MINDNVISLINLESLRDFEAKSGIKVDHERFRANIVIDGLAAMQELELAKKKIKIGNVVLNVFCNTPRCKATNFPYRSKIRYQSTTEIERNLYHIDFNSFKANNFWTNFLNDTVSVLDD